MKRNSFPKRKRLVSNEQFKAVLDHKTYFYNDLLKLFIAKNEVGFPRLGISVGKSVGKAVLRNRIRRLIREAFRQNQEEIPSEYDYLVMISHNWLKNFDKPEDAKSAIKKLTFRQIEASFLALVKKMG